MSEKRPPRSIQDLDARLKQLRAEIQPPKDRDAGVPQSGVGMAFTVAGHMVAGLAVGAGIGYLLDRVFGTSPWLLVVFFFLGAASGMLNVYRTARGMGMTMGYRPAADGNDDPRKGSPEPVACGDEKVEKNGNLRG
jgi:ATP synthase protein I